MDENYEWDAELTLESDILAALQLYRSGDPARPVSTIALRDLERQSECSTPAWRGWQTLPWGKGGVRALWHPRPCTRVTQLGQTLCVSPQSPAAARPR